MKFDKDAMKRDWKLALSAILWLAVYIVETLEEAWKLAETLAPAEVSA